jgi:hypothetical protein
VAAYCQLEEVTRLMGVVVHDVHAPRFRSGSGGPYQGSLPARWFSGGSGQEDILQIVDSEELVVAPPAEEMGHRILS